MHGGVRQTYLSSYYQISCPERKDESLSIVRDVHYRQAYMYFIYKVISIEAPKSNFQGIPLLPGLPVDKKRVRI